jgi:hypothetical protein
VVRLRDIEGVVVIILSGATLKVTLRHKCLNMTTNMVPSSKFRLRNAEPLQQTKFRMSTRTIMKNIK